MTDPNAIRDDIAFMRNLAEAGRNGPVAGGSIMLASGLIFGAASLAVSWAFGHRETSASWAQYIWPAAAISFFAFLMLAKRRQSRSGALRGPAARAVAAIWSGIGMAMFFIILSLMIMASTANDWRIAAAIGPIFMSLYGAAWFAAARLSGRRWLFAVGCAAFTMSGITALVFRDYATGFLIYGLSLILLVGLPGFVLMRNARAG